MRGERTSVTERERQALAAVTMLGRNQDAATALRIAPTTLRHHLASAYAKTGAHTVAQALYRLGFVDMDRLVR